VKAKTKENYTHVTTKGFDQIVSPLDQLELAKKQAMFKSLKQNVVHN